MSLHGIIKQGITTVKAPYVRLAPYIIDWDENNPGSCVVSIYVFLTNGELTKYEDLKLNTMEWRRYVSGITTAELGLGPYNIEGIRKLTIWIYSPTDLIISIGYSNDNSIGIINYKAHTRIAETFEVYGTQFYITIKASSTPWEFDMTFTLSP